MHTALAADVNLFAMCDFCPGYLLGPPLLEKKFLPVGMSYL